MCTPFFYGLQSLEFCLKKGDSLHEKLLVGLCVRPMGSSGKLEEMTVGEKSANAPHFFVVSPDGFVFPRYEQGRPLEGPAVHVGECFKVHAAVDQGLDVDLAEVGEEEG